VACDATADLLGVVDELGLWENTVIVILSDHGEEFWEHSVFFADHNPASIHGELLNVPFMLRDPDHVGAGLRIVDAEVSTVDLLPTVADLIGVSPTDRCDGVSVVSGLQEGGSIDRHIPIMALTHSRDNPLPMRAAIVRGGMKYIQPVTPEPGQESFYPLEEQLYDLTRDWREEGNLAPRRPETVTELSELLRRGLEAAAPQTVAESPDSAGMPVTESLRNQLRALGYVDDL
jgi:arylsulfatase A-like enzyme